MHTQLKKELYWSLQGKKIIFNKTNPLLRKVLEFDNEKSAKKAFIYLEWLKNPRADYEIIDSLKDSSEMQSLYNYLKTNKYIKQIGTYNDDTRLNRYISSYLDILYQDYQDKLGGVSVMIIGLGTGGSYLIEGLSKIGMKKFVVIDGDKVEKDNLLAQNYLESDVGRYKADAIFEKYKNNDFKITPITSYIHDYKDIENIINRENIDYLIYSADNYSLLINILNNIFQGHEEIVLFTGGYGILQEKLYKITSKNVNLFLKNEVSVEPKREIYANSGSILNALFYTFSVTKMVFDSIFELPGSNFAFADFYLNQYFIGNSYDYHLYSLFKKEQQKKFRFINKDINTENNWVEKISKANLTASKLIKQPLLNDTEKKYMRLKINNIFSFDLGDIDNQYKREEKIVATDQDISENLIEYISKEFGSKVCNYVINLIHNGQIYLGSSHHFEETVYTNKIATNYFISFINSCGSDIEQTVLYIGEIFKQIYFYVDRELSIYKETIFLTKHLIQFCEENIDNNRIKELSNYILESMEDNFIPQLLTVEYEKHILLDKVSNFIKYYADVYKTYDNLARILDDNIEYDNPFSKLPNIIAIKENKKIIVRLKNRLKGAN